MDFEPCLIQLLVVSFFKRPIRYVIFLIEKLFLTPIPHFAHRFHFQLFLIYRKNNRKIIKLSHFSLNCTKDAHLFI